MRTDHQLAEGAVRQSGNWKRDEINGNESAGIDTRLDVGSELVAGKLVVHSLSGKERNRLFLNEESGTAFSDVSALSGIDSASDSRGFALLDYDRDGWQDMALVNANQPLTQLFHNDLGSFPGQKGGVIALRFEGGSTEAKPSSLSNRDGYGAMVEVTLEGGLTIIREHLCGTGFATQNSSTMIIGIGEKSQVTSVSVRWPSGKTTTTKDIPEGTLLTAFENRAAESFSQKPYRITQKATPAATRKVKLPIANSSSKKVQVFTTMASWCPACIGHLPALSYLKSDDIALFGIPLDVNDTSEILADYVAQKNPAYEILADLSTSVREQVSAFLGAAMGTESLPLPSTVITDSEGNVLEVMSGVPSLSRVRHWMPQTQ
ncbi:MAG: peroxiredoxin [Akkermansiaceae bacterium]